MAIKFKVIERGQPGVAGGGAKKNYASAVSVGEFTLEHLTRAIEKTNIVNGADLRTVLYAMVEESIENLGEGRIVRLEDLGSLRVSISSEGVDNANDVSGCNRKSAKVVFTPGVKIKNMQATVKYAKSNHSLII